MKGKLIFVIAALGLISGLVAAYVLGERHQPLAPLFDPAQNPYQKGIFANGIIESSQDNGENLNLYPEVAGTVTHMLVKEGGQVKAGAPLLTLDDAIQKATTEQLRLQAEAARSLLEELRAQPRREQLALVQAQLEAARANLRTVEDQYGKLRKAYELDSGAVSKDALDNAENAFKTAQANVGVAQRQLDLTRAGAWAYEIRTQENQFLSLTQSYQSAKATLARYTMRAPVDGVVMAINTGSGGYVSPQGAYGTYTGGQNPVIVMSSSQEYLSVRCFVDEILLHRLPHKGDVQAQLSVRGTSLKIPLEFVRMQPYVTPKIQLSDQRQERVDLRVLPVVFRFKKPPDARLYPGQLVDVYIAEDASPPASAPKATPSR